VHHGVVVAVVVAGVVAVARGGVQPPPPCRRRRHGASVAPALVTMVMTRVGVPRRRRHRVHAVQQRGVQVAVVAVVGVVQVAFTTRVSRRQHTTLSVTAAPLTTAMPSVMMTALRPVTAARGPTVTVMMEVGVARQRARLPGRRHAGRQLRCSPPSWLAGVGGATRHLRRRRRVAPPPPTTSRTKTTTTTARLVAVVVVDVTAAPCNLTCRHDVLELGKLELGELELELDWRWRVSQTP